MGKIFEQQEDGSLKPIEYPKHLVKNADLCEWLNGKGFNLEEIKYLISESPC